MRSRHDANTRLREPCGARTRSPRRRRAWSSLSPSRWPRAAATRASPSADPSDAGPERYRGPEAPPPLETTATLGKVTGKLPKAKRSKVRKQVARAVDGWIDAAYVGGDYPRNDFATAWPGFTTGAKVDAEGRQGPDEQPGHRRPDRRRRGDHPQGRPSTCSPSRATPPGRPRGSC